jgi:ribosomal protein S18 acetylase RimI-like enzyme
MVKPTAQSQGIGTSMIQAYFQEQKGQKVVVITNGIKSKRFYERNGFQVMAGRQFCKQQVFLLTGPD